MKRAFDICAAAAGLAILSPVLALIGLLIKVSDWGPVLYRQQRVGRFGKLFKILKFRTMVLGADKTGALVTRDRDPRITSIGRFLRKTKLDELPQLWNVLAGDMSFVGPRPEVARYVAHYNEEQSRILQYRPGITDMATVLFRNEEQLLKSVDDVEKFYIQNCLPKKLELNFRYQEKATLWTDLAVIGQTLLPYWAIVFGLYNCILLTSLAVAYYVRFEGCSRRPNRSTCNTGSRSLS
jgi:lipopolysaccharide/colanic/teichoic acid biosynthesis glycosyltransferase